jgi:hypothetical protein
VLTIVNGHITSNTAASGGGIYYRNGASLNLVKTEVADNTPDDIYREASSSVSTDTFFERP